MPSNDDYDTPWKDALTRYFPEFMAFYFPRAHAEIDWRQPHVFLDQELAQVVQDAQLGKRLVDCLVQIATRDGGEQWVYIHVEVQGQQDADFAERLFTYNYRLYDRYRRPVASLAVLADERENWKPTRFSYQLFGCEVGIRFPVVKLLDYANQTESLLEDPNPFALVTAAHLFTRRTKGDPEQRYAAKWRLAKLLYERNWDKQRIIDLFGVIDWLMRLPTELEQRLLQEVYTLERKVIMPYVTSAERFGIEKGRQEGRQEGEASLLKRQLARRFGTLPDAVQVRLTTATIDQLEEWAIRVLDAESLDAVFDQRPQ
ncbi:MAG: DUF4351 domain-containing protein [Accumulibacter sp.]